MQAGLNKFSQKLYFEDLKMHSKTIEIKYEDLSLEKFMLNKSKLILHSRSI